MIPGELFTEPGEHALNTGRRTLTVVVRNTGDRPIQVGSHYHFFETNPALAFDRQAARGMRLDIAAGTAVRFEHGGWAPGSERVRSRFTGWPRILSRYAHLAEHPDPEK